MRMYHCTTKNEIQSEIELLQSNKTMIDFFSQLIVHISAIFHSSGHMIKFSNKYALENEVRSSQMSDNQSLGAVWRDGKK